MSDSKPEIPPDGGLTEIETSLGSLAPSPGRLDRDRLMYLAGQQSARRSPWSRVGWPSVAAAFGLVAFGEAMLLVGRREPEPRIVERVVVVREPAPALAADPVGEIPESLPMPPEPEAEVVILRRSPRSEASWMPRSATTLPTPSDSSPAALRLRVLRDGIDALPEPPALPVAMRPNQVEPVPTGRSFRAELDRLLNPGESS